MNAPLPRPTKRRGLPIKPEDRGTAARRSLDKAMSRLAKAAAERGLTDEKLEQILMQMRRRGRWPVGGLGASFSTRTS